MKNRLLLGAFALALAAPAQATSIVQVMTQFEDPDLIRSFDPKLGTLTSVRVDLEMLLELRTWIYWGLDRPTVPQTLTTTVTTDPVLLIYPEHERGWLGLYPEDRTFTFTEELDINKWDLVLYHNVRDLQSYTFTDSPTLDLFRGPGVITPMSGVYGSAALVTTSGRTFYPDSPLNRMSITTTYNYVPAVPEPSTWAMLIAGFGMVGAAVRRARKTPLKASLNA